MDPGDIVYPTGLKLALLMTSIFVDMFLVSLVGLMWQIQALSAAYLCVCNLNITARRIRSSFRPPWDHDWRCTFSTPASSSHHLRLWLRFAYNVVPRMFIIVYTLPLQKAAQVPRFLWCRIWHFFDARPAGRRRLHHRRHLEMVLLHQSSSGRRCYGSDFRLAPHSGRSQQQDDF